MLSKLESQKVDSGVLGMPVCEYVTRSVASAGSKNLGKDWLECAGQLAHLQEETEPIQKIIQKDFGTCSDTALGRRY